MASFKLAQFTDYVESAGAGAYGSSASVPSSNIFTIIGDLIGVVLSFLGVILLILMIYAGFLWMTARGDSKQVQTAKDILRNAIIGMIIVLASYALTSEIMLQLFLSINQV